MSSLSEPSALTSWSLRRAAGPADVGRVTLLQDDDAAAERSARESVVVAVNGEGVTIFDLPTQSPLQKLTVPPSTAFSTAALTTIRAAPFVISPETSDTTVSPERTLRRTTAVGIHTGAAEGELWVWQEEAKGKLGIGGQAKKESVRIKEPPHSVHALSLTPNSLLCVSNSASVYLLTVAPDSSHVVTETLKHHEGGQRVLHHVSSHNVADLAFLPASTSSLDRERPVGAILIISSRLPSEATSKSKANGHISGSNQTMPENPGAVSIQLVLVGGEESDRDRLAWGAETVIPDVSGEQLASISVHTSGVVSYLTTNGTLVSTAMSGRISSGTHPFSLSLQQRSSQSLASLDFRPPSVALLSLSSSHVLLAARAAVNSPVRLLLWDTVFSALLAEQEVPGTATATSRLSVTLRRGPANAEGSRALLRIGPEELTSATKNSKATLYVVPYVVPSRSSLLEAMGKATKSARYCVSSPSVSTSSTSAVVVGEGASTSAVDEGELDRRTLLRQLEEVLSSSTMTPTEAASAAEARFLDWTASRTAALRAVFEADTAAKEQAETVTAADAAPEAKGRSGRSRKVKTGEGDDSDSEGDVMDVDGQAEEQQEGTGDVDNGSGKKKERPPKVPLPYQFVTSLLALSLPPTSSRPYPSKIIAYLLERRSVSARMVRTGEETGGEGGHGLLERLRDRRDWANILLALRTVPDLPESSLIALLADVAQAKRDHAKAAASGEPGSTQVEDGSSGAGVPSLASYLSHLLPLQLSAPLLRRALKARLSDADEVSAVMTVMVRWLRWWDERALDGYGAQGVPSGEKKLKQMRRRKAKREKAAAVAAAMNGGVNVDEERMVGNVPWMSQILSFTLTLLDTHFPLLLSHAPSHALLKELSSAINVHLSFCTQLSILRGPLEAFKRVDEDRLRAARLGRTGTVGGRAKGAVADKGGVAGTGKEEVGGGLTTVDERSKATSRRRRAYEASMVVGEYGVELFEL